MRQIIGINNERVLVGCRFLEMKQPSARSLILTISIIDGLLLLIGRRLAYRPLAHVTLKDA